MVQRGAEAVYSKEGQTQVKKLVSFYMDNARLIKSNLTSAGFEVFGATNAPYAWIKTPRNMNSWDYFDF